MTPTTFGSDFKRILIAYKPHENKQLHSDEIPQMELPLIERLYYKLCCTCNIKELWRRELLWIQTTGTGFIHSSAHDSIWKSEFWLFWQKVKRRPPYICIYELWYFSFWFKINFWHKLALLCWLCNYTQCLHWLCIDPADPPCHFFLTCSCAISALNTATMISYLLEAVTGLKKIYSNFLIKKTVITVTFEIQSFFNLPSTNTHFLFCYANKIEIILLENSKDSTVYLNFKTH